MRLNPITRKNGSELVKEAIIGYIRERKLAPGARLAPDRELAAMLGCSRTVVREALKGLEAVGIIEMKVGKGIFVADFTLGTFMEKYQSLLAPSIRDWHCLKDARLAIELGIVDLAVERATQEDIGRLEAVIAAMEKTRSAGKMRALDIGFHQTLAHIARSPLLTEFSGVLRKFFMLAEEGEKAAGARTPAKTRQTNAATHREHRALVAAIAARDTLLARKRITEHLATPPDPRTL